MNDEITVYRVGIVVACQCLTEFEIGTENPVNQWSESAFSQGAFATAQGLVIGVKNLSEVHSFPRKQAVNNLFCQVCVYAEHGLGGRIFNHGNGLVGMAVQIF